MCKATLFTRAKKLPQMSINWDKKWQMHCMQTDYNSALERALSSDRYWNMDPSEKYCTWKKHIKITSCMILCLWNVYMEFIEKGDENYNLFLFLSYPSTHFSRVHPVLGRHTGNIQRQFARWLFIWSYLYIKQWKIQKLKQATIIRKMFFLTRYLFFRL